MDQSTTTAGSETSGSTSAPTIGDAQAALALADSSFATPDAQTTSADTPAAATAQPDATTEASVTDTTKPKDGEPPKWRWQDILANAREASAKEAEARARQEIEQQYAWAQGISEPERQGLLTWRAAMSGDQRAIDHLKANPQVVTWLKGLVAEQAHPQADPEPEPDAQSADGTLFFSAEKQKAREALLRRQIAQEVRSELLKEIAPLQNVAQTFQQREAAAAYQTNVASVIASMSDADPDFKAHRADVGQVIQGDKRLTELALGTDTMPADPALAIELAWARVYRSKVLPAKQSQTEAQVVASLQQRAVAATTNPAAATSATPRSTLGDARAALEHASATLGG